MYITAGISIAGLLCIAQLSNFQKYRYQFLQGLLLQIVFLCLGIVVMQNVLESRIQETRLIAVRKNGVVYVMRLTEPLQLKNKIYKTAAVIESIGHAKQEIKTNIKIIVRLAVDSSLDNMRLLTAGSYIATTIQPTGCN